MSGGIQGFRSNPFIKLPQLSPNAATPEVEGGGTRADFQQMLMDSINQVGAQQIEANQAVEMMLTGNDSTQVEAMIAMKKSELAFRTLLQVRNKLIDAYNEIKDMRF